jgi:hypothetical protein
MEKKKIIVEIPHLLCEDNGRYGLSMSIDSFIESLKEAKLKGAETINIESNIEYDCSYNKITFKLDRLETDEEFNKRVNDIKQREALIEQKELEQLEMLKIKYRGKFNGEESN